MCVLRRMTKVTHPGDLDRSILCHPERSEAKSRDLVFCLGVLFGCFVWGLFCNRPFLMRGCRPAQHLSNFMQ
jgi:hypothetical protein